MSTAPSHLRQGGTLAARILFSLIFIVAGAGHLFSPDSIMTRLAEAPGASLVGALPQKTLVILSGLALLLGGLALASGLLTRWAAGGLALVLLPITLTVQVGGAQGLGPLFKNIALLGGLLHYALEGGGLVSLDHWLRERWRLRPLVAGAAGLLIIAVGIPALAAPARPAATPGERVLFLVQQPPQLSAALMTGQQSLKGQGFPAREVEIIVCGPAIASLLKGDAMEPKLREARRAGVRVVACGITLEEKGIASEALSTEVGLVDNGLVEALKRQAEGFRSVEL